MIYVLAWQRDCDMVESTTRHSFHHKQDLENFKKDFYEGAEGPTSIDIVSKSDFDSFEPYFRDRCLEAYENGNGNSLYV